MAGEMAVKVALMNRIGSHLLVRKEDVLCTRCCTMEPVHAGHGMPLPTFIEALALCVLRHQNCKPKGKKHARR